MWWQRRRGSADLADPTATVGDPGREPLPAVVLAVTEPLTGATADRLSGEVERLDRRTAVVIDLTAIPSFDSEGTAGLAGLQDRRGSDHVTIVGLRQAAARLTGAALESTPPATQAG